MLVLVVAGRGPGTVLVPAPRRVVAIAEVLPRSGEVRVVAGGEDRAVDRIQEPGRAFGSARAADSDVAGTDEHVRRPGRIERRYRGTRGRVAAAPQHRDTEEQQRGSLRPWAPRAAQPPSHGHSIAALVLRVPGPAGLSEDAGGLAGVARRRRDDGLLADQDLASISDRRAHVVLADERRRRL